MRNLRSQSSRGDQLGPWPQETARDIAENALLGMVCIRPTRSYCDFFRARGENITLIDGGAIRTHVFVAMELSITCNTRRAEVSDNEAKISQEEMISMFGKSMPTEAVNLLWQAPDDMTVGEIRKALRKMVTVCELCGQRRTWCNQYDCPGLLWAYN